MLFSADFYKTTEEAKEQMWQYFQSPQEYETNDEGSLTILHKVELTDKDMEYLQTKTGNIVDKIQEIDSILKQCSLNSLLVISSACTKSLGSRIHFPFSILIR